MITALEDFDQLFNKSIFPIPQFSFNQDVARVFDNMALRSIPYYAEVQKWAVQLAVDFFIPGTVIYDLGFSTGTTILLLLKHFTQVNQIDVSKQTDFSIVGYENSAAMLKQAQEKLKDYTFSNQQNVHLYQEDITAIQPQNASVIILNYTLQFIAPEKRKKLLQTLYDSLLPGGIVLISEKTNPKHPLSQEMFTRYYYDFKRNNGYSELEIAQKREALEQVLIPFSISEYMDILSQTGFCPVEIFFSWFNFTSFLCVKPKESAG